MLVGIYKSEYPEFQIKRNEIYKRILKFNSIPFIEMDIHDKDFWEKVQSLDLFLFRWAHIDDHHQLAMTILPIIENYLTVKCFPNLNTCWHFDDKIKQYYLLKSHNYPAIESYIFWEKDNALEWANKIDYPIVFKLKKGAGATNVILLKNYSETKKIIKQIFGQGISPKGIKHKGTVKYKNLEDFLRNKFDRYFLNKVRNVKPLTWQIEKNYALFQKFLPNNAFDTRVTTIGKRVFAFRRFVRENDFRASGSGKIDFDKSKIDLRFIKIALEISQKLKFQSMAYDFLFNENGEPEICEMSYTFVDWGVQKCPGFWDEDLNWHPGNYWPQYLHLKDLLNLNDLKQPIIDDIKS